MEPELCKLVHRLMLHFQHDWFVVSSCLTCVTVSSTSAYNVACHIEHSNGLAVFASALHGYTADGNMVGRLASAVTAMLRQATSAARDVIANSGLLAILRDLSDGPLAHDGDAMDGIVPLLALVADLSSVAVDS